jgi:hypothetical protein
MVHHILYRELDVYHIHTLLIFLFIIPVLDESGLSLIGTLIPNFHLYGGGNFGDSPAFA